MRILGGFDSNENKKPSECSVTHDRSPQCSQYGPRFTAGWNIVSYARDKIFLCAIINSVIIAILQTWSCLLLTSAWCRVCHHTDMSQGVWRTWANARLSIITYVQIFVCNGKVEQKQNDRLKKTRKTCAVSMLLTDSSLTFSLLVCAVIDLCVAPRSAVL